jgi:hypothetical protein
MIIFKSVKKLEITSQSINFQNIGFQEIGKLSVRGDFGYETFNSIQNLPVIPQAEFNLISALISSVPGNTFESLSFSRCDAINIDTAVTSDYLRIKWSSVEDMSKFIVKHFISLYSVTTIVSGEHNKVLLEGESIGIYEMLVKDYELLKFTENVKHLTLYSYYEIIQGGLMELPSHIQSIHFKSCISADIPFTLVSKFNRIQIDNPIKRLRERNWEGYKKSFNSQNTSLILSRINMF